MSAAADVPVINQGDVYGNDASLPIGSVPGDRRPHVLAVMADQFRWDCLGIVARSGLLPDAVTVPRTPALDRLAADGAWFPNTYCPLPVCTPSRYSLLSGQYVHQHGGWTNRCTLGQEIQTFPRELRVAGYRTHAVGKMHFTPTYLDVGFHTMALAEQNGAGRYDDDYHRELMAAGLVPSSDLIDQEREWRDAASPEYWETLGAARSNLPEEWHSTTWIGNRAVEAIERWSDQPERPQLLMASFIKPHHPFDPPAPWDTLYDPEALAPLPGWTDTPTDDDLRYNAGYFPHEQLTDARLRCVMALYFATITQLDHHVGRMIESLERQGLYERTMIIFTADHGEYLGYHHLLLKGGRMYEPLARVPLIMKPASGGEGGVRGMREALASIVDVAPTILRAAGLEPPREMRGLDLSDPAASREYVFTENRRGTSYMVRSRRHKLLLERDSDQTRLFDLESDPYELRDLSRDQDQSDILRTLRDALANWMLFESPTPVRLDDRAPVISTVDGVAPGLEHRATLLAFFRTQMARSQDLVGEGADS